MKKAAKILITVLVFLELSIAIATLPSETTTAKAALQADMPVIFVDPLNATADVGDTFTMSVKIFNLTGNTYTTNEAWHEGGGLPPFEPSYYRYKYSLGNIYGFDLQLSWDPTILQYVTHTVTVPVQDYPGGILNGPIINQTDTVDPDAGTYWLALLSQAPAEEFNAPGQNATVFNMTFNVVKPGKCAISFTNIDLPVHLLELGTAYYREAPHWAVGCEFQTRNLLTRIESLQGGAPVGESLLYDPAIRGENIAIRVAMKNDNETVSDVFNLSIYDGATLLNEWKNVTINPGMAMTLNHTFDDPAIGTHIIKANASILHAGVIVTDGASKNLTVIGEPVIEISGPTSASPGQVMPFSATVSFPEGSSRSIANYTWTLWAPGEPKAKDTADGASVELEIPSGEQLVGNWTVMLILKDEYGITVKQSSGSILSPTSDLLRPATEPYRKLFTVRVQEASPIGLTTEWIVLIVILIVVIALAAFYIRRRSR